MTVSDDSRQDAAEAPAEREYPSGPDRSTEPAGKRRVITTPTPSR